MYYLYSNHFTNMDFVLKSEKYLLHRLYSSWGMDHLLQLGTGYSGLDES